MAFPKGLQYCGCIAIDALEHVGSGVEGWLENPSVVFAMSRDQIAFARERILIMQLRWKGPGDGSEALMARIGFSSEFQEAVTSLEWLVFDEFSVLAVGTSSGALLLYSQGGIMLFRQHFYAGPVLRIRARQDCNLIVGTTASEDVCIVFPKAILRIDVMDIYTLLQRFVPRRERSRDGTSSGRRSEDLQRVDTFNFMLPYEMWNISKSTASRACVDGVLACVMAPPLLEHQLKRHYCALTVGADYTLAAFRVSGEKRNSLAGIVFDKVMPAAVSTVTSLAKRFWRNDPTSETNRPTEVTPQAFGRATLITTLLDNRRQGVSLAVSPSGSLAAVTDSLGRISLVDVQALVVVRLWKGYREAHCMFLEAPRDGRTGYEETQKKRRSALDRDDFSLCLAIHAPRKRVVEVWQMRYGARLMVVRCTESCLLIQPSCKFKFSNELLTLESTDQDEFLPTKVYIFYGNSGILSLLNPFSQSSYSLTEAFCIAIVEAACCGMLTISTRVGGVPEVLPSDMIILAEPVPARIVASIARAIELLPQINPFDMHRRVRTLYSWTDVAQRIETVYAHAVNSLDQDILHRLNRYYACGPWVGKLFCLVIVLAFIIWHILKWWQHAEQIDVAPDFHWEDEAHQKSVHSPRF